MCKTIEARELPASWREEGRFLPDEQVTVRIEPAEPELERASSLAELMNIIGRRAQARGLTEEKLREILDEDR